MKQRPIVAIESCPMSGIRREKISWLWQDRLARGKLHTLDGDPGLAKSTITLDVAARISTASPFPDGKPMEYPGNVILLNAEDGLGDTIRPRLEAAGADLDRVHYFNAIEREGSDDFFPPDLPDDLDALESVVAELEATLIVIDPLTAFLSSKTDSHRDHDIRRALSPMAALADRTGAAVWAVRHLNKTPGGTAIQRGGGSIAIVGAARSAMMVGVDPDDEAKRILAMTKSNLAPLAPSLSYRLVSDEEYDCGRIQWLGTIETSAADLVSVQDEDARTAEGEAIHFLLEELADGAKRGAEVKRDAGKLGISERTLNRAKAKLRIESHKVGAPGSDDQMWVWELPILPTRTEGGQHGPN